MARPASPEVTACARIWAVDRGTGASQRPGSLPALRVARYSPVGFDRQRLQHPKKKIAGSTTAYATLYYGYHYFILPSTTIDISRRPAQLDIKYRQY